MADLRRAGMHPYRTHMAARLFRVAKAALAGVARGAARWTGELGRVLPALETGRAALIWTIAPSPGSRRTPARSPV